MVEVAEESKTQARRLNKATWILALATIVLAVATVVLIFVTAASG